MRKPLFLALFIFECDAQSFASGLKSAFTASTYAVSQNADGDWEVHRTNPVR